MYPFTQPSVGRGTADRSTLFGGSTTKSPRMNGWDGAGTAQPSSPSNGREEDSGVIQDIYYLNSLNRTLVAAWDLQDPDPNNPSKRSRQRATEKLGMGRDRRNRVSTQHILPGGKYRAICKIFMGFSESKGFEYMGTGWLIAKDIVVTAAHCLYDSDGGYLRSVKVYIGYEGPEDTALNRNMCEMRLGEIATIPAEYIKTAHTVHDVGFIKLQEPFNDVEPFRPESTPRSSAGMKLGVVGYPGDIEGGNEMYEHWDMTTFDLAENGFLSYQIDTEVGESGSPILREIAGTQKLAPIGVHTDGGHPNSGSVIGPLGNSFADYTTAIKIKQTHTLTPGARRIPVPRLVGARNLEYISIAEPKGSITPIDPDDGPARKKHGKESSALPESSPSSGSLFGPIRRSQQHREAAKIIADLESPISKTKSAQTTMAKEAARTVKDLESGFAGSRPAKESSRQTSQFIKDLVTVMTKQGGLPLPYGPEETEDSDHPYLPTGQERAQVGRTAEMFTSTAQRLPVTAYKESGALSGESQEELINQINDRMKNEEGLKTKFFLNFPPRLEGEAKEELKKTMRYVQEWQCWAYALAALKTQQQISQGKLTSEATKTGAAKRSAYENMVYDHVMRGSPWVSKTLDEVQEREFNESKASFHTALIKAVINGFILPGGFLKTLHDVLDTISNGILEVSKKSRTQELQYFIMLTKYDYEPLTQTVQPSIRVISFKTSASVNTFTFGKNSFDNVKLKFLYRQYQCDFNSHLYGQTQDEMNRQLLQAGRKFSGLSVDDIDLQADSASPESMRLPLRSRHKQSALVQETVASYDNIVENLTPLTDLCKGSGTDQDGAAGISEILGAESIDAGLATLIGMRLAVQGQEQLKEMTPQARAEAINSFPKYWQLLGSLVFKQLFSDTTIPTSLRFYAAEEELRSEVRKQIEEKTTLEKHNQSLQYALDAAKIKAEAQAKEIEGEKETVKVLRKLVSETGQLQIEKLEAENEKLRKEKEGDARDIRLYRKKCDDTEQQRKNAQLSEAEAKTLLQQSQAREEMLKIKVKELDDRLKGKVKELDDRLKRIRSATSSSYRADGDVFDLNHGVRHHDLDTSPLSEVVPFDKEFSNGQFKVPYVLAGICDLESADKIVRFEIRPDGSREMGFDIVRAKNSLLPNLKVSWLALSGFDDDICAERYDHVGLEVAGSNVITQDVKKPIPEDYCFCMYVDSFQMITTGTIETIQLELSGQRTATNLVVTSGWSLSCFEKIGYGWFAYNPKTDKGIKTGYINHNNDCGHSKRWTVEFEPPFNRTPVIFIGLYSFGECKPEHLRFKAEVISVDECRMVVETTKGPSPSDAGPAFVRFLWIAVQ